MNDLSNSGGYPTIAACELQQSSPRKQLEQRRDNLKSRLDTVEAALTALDANPQVADVLEAVGKALNT